MTNVGAFGLIHAVFKSESCTLTTLHITVRIITCYERPTTHNHRYLYLIWVAFLHIMSVSQPAMRGHIIHYRMYLYLLREATLHIMVISLPAIKGHLHINICTRCEQPHNISLPVVRSHLHIILHTMYVSLPLMRGHINLPAMNGHTTHYCMYDNLQWGPPYTLPRVKSTWLHFQCRLRKGLGS